MAEQRQTNRSITRKTIAAAEKLVGVDFTDPERKQMLKLVRERRGQVERIHSTKLPNDVPFALTFDPRPPALRSPHSARSKPTIGLSPAPKVTCPSNLEDVAFWPVTHLAELVRTRQVKSVELTEMYLARLRRYNPALECVVTFTEDRAMQQAKQADQEIAKGQYRGPLHGIPWGAKDLLAVKGYPTTWGAEPYKDQVIDADATVVKRLDEAGAVLIAKLTLGALAYGDIWFGGVTKNPWDISEGSSGSSAGSASATAAGLVGCSIGTETLGSIVSPSTRCGVTGLRPTFGRVSRHGAMTLVWSMDKIGPICRTVEDCVVVFDAIYGPDGEDPTVVNMPFEWNPERKATGLRVGYVKSAFDEEHDHKANDDRVLDVLRSLGINLIPVDLPKFDYEPMFIVLLAEAAAAFDEITRDNLDDQMKWQADEAWPNLFRQARLIPAVEYVQANRIRTLMMRQMAELMEQVDVIVTPSFGGGALFLTNLTGNPAVVLPNGFTDKHTLTSITFIGGLYREAEVLGVAKAYQDATDFHKQHPAMEFDAKK